MVYVTVSQSIVLGSRHQGAVACFRHEDEHSFRRGDSSLTAKKLVPDAAGTGCSHVPSEQVVSVDCDHLCRDCDGTGWVLYRSETKDGEFEEAYHLCPKGHAPRYCMGSSSGNLCYRPATVRCGLGYYCMEHIVAIRENTDIDNPSEAIQRPSGFGMLLTPRVEGAPYEGEHSLEALQVPDRHRAPVLPSTARAIERQVSGIQEEALR